MAIQKESPLIVDCLAAETNQGACEEAAKLPGRINRYSIARHKALEIRDYVNTLPGYGKVTTRLHNCGNYLVFRDYYSIGKVKLAGMHSCYQHLLCPLCAIRRGAKLVRAYLARLAVIQQRNPKLKPYLVTFTEANGADLGERFQHITESHKEMLQQRRNAIKGQRPGIEANKAVGAVWSYEVKRGSGSGLWHPHMHAIWLCEEAPDQEQLRREWKEITGDSHIVDVTAFHEGQDPVKGFLEVFKYAVKFSDMELADQVTAYELLKGRRLVGSFGDFRGVEVPEELTDEGLADDLPYIEMFYRFIRGSGYNFVEQRTVVPAPGTMRLRLTTKERARLKPALRPTSEDAPPGRVSAEDGAAGVVGSPDKETRVKLYRALTEGY